MFKDHVIKNTFRYNFKEMKNANHKIMSDLHLKCRVINFGFVRELRHILNSLIEHWSYSRLKLFWEFF